MCANESAVYRQRFECIGGDRLNYLDQLRLSTQATRTRFIARNSDSSLIRDTRVPNVVYVPSDFVTNSKLLSEFLRWYPPPAVGAVALLSAPAYLEDGSAVIFYHQLDASGGFIHLALRETRWSVTDLSTWVE